ncbi:uncharacterized protein LOC131934574 [Physella acuta]|uniref:uncharacterized protein LOC131934574 n=1 Tax=Physella acuta TaxID=109671 RepID=UPI0027DE9AD3|nr:uncharacterized protein LOC131934574 [Physella acuta]
MLKAVSGVVVFLGAVVAVSGIHIDATPSNVVVGVTRYLDVKCSITRGDDSSMESLISLIISRSTNPQDTNFKELASLTMFTPEVQIKDISEVNITASGKIDNNGESYIKLLWEYPDATKSGVYQCEAHGIDHTGHPAYVNVTTLVSSTHPDVETLTGQIKTLTSLIEQLTKRQDNLTLDETNLKGRVNSWNRRLEVARQNFFKISPVFNGRRYLLSKKQITFVVDDFVGECNLFGGYLAEIDSEAEYNFIIQHLLATDRNYYCALIGATDEGHENIWINKHSNTTVTFFKWPPGGPDSGTLQNYNTSEREAMASQQQHLHLKPTQTTPHPKPTQPTPPPEANTTYTST